MVERLESTEVIQEEKRVLQAVLACFSRAATRLDLSASHIGPQTGAEVVGAIRSAQRRGVRTRLLTQVTMENLATVRAASDYLQVRHLSGLTGNSWAVTDGEYISSLTVGEFRASLPIVHSDAASLVTEHKSIFDALWARGEPLEERGESLESGTDLPEMEVIRDPQRARELYLSLVEGAKREVLLIFPTPEAFRREDALGVIEELERRASKGVRVRLLVPVDQEVLQRLRGKDRPRLEFRAVLQAEGKETVTVLVVDGSASLTIDEQDPTQEVFEKGFGSALIITREPRVRQNVRLFDRIWKESELGESERLAREREEASRKRAELMQDILTHDIRNFNQAARLNAELLGEDLKRKDDVERVTAILRALDGSTRLIERAKKLGSILAAKDVSLHPMSLRGSVQRSTLLVRKANPDVELKVGGKISGEVLADELLDEVFVNVIANAVKYTKGETVRVDLGQEPGELPGGPGTRPKPCWKVSVSDHGEGIPDRLKPVIFRRYLETAKGSGLGLSIVYALVNDRYDGRVVLRNRVADDHSKGTAVEIWLPQP